MELGEHVVGERERRAEAHVDAAAAEHLPRDDALGLTSEEAGRRDAVAAEIAERSAVELGRQPGVAGVRRQREPEVGPDHPQLADGALAHELLERGASAGCGAT